MAIKSTHSLSKKQKFDIFLPVIDETFSLVKTIEIIEKYNSRFISQYIIVISKTKPTIASKVNGIDKKSSSREYPSPKGSPMFEISPK